MTTKVRGMNRWRMLALAAGGILVVAGALAMVLPIIFPVTSCDFQGETDVCYLITFRVPVFGGSSLGAPLWLGPPLLVIGLILLLAGSRNRWFVGGLAVAIGVMAVLLAPLAETCAWSSDAQACETIGTIVFNVFGVASLVFGAALIAFASWKRLKARQSPNLADATT